MKLTIVSGLSGSGKSVALHMLEDMGYYCIDNLPVAVLRNFVRETVATGDPAYSLMAVGVDARNRPEEVETLPDLLETFAQEGIHCELVFLDADEDVLLRRYSETRRRHPLAGEQRTLPDAIREERRILSAIAERADLVIDTSRLTANRLRELVHDRLGREGKTNLSLMFESFGFKHGVPRDADFVFDVRCLPNPHWEPALRPRTGRDQEVIEYLEKSELATRMVGDLIDFLDQWLPPFEVGRRSYVTVAVGCTGGQHRSVYVVDKLAAHFREKWGQVLTRHISLD
ncbi:RNase adapter RapZ [Gammaproteobacteria bacterium AB-CW1]|uniref:RNase adapter RapZ n=1 Tax=Natronospira elongata TaxID=3110268 RepID=A0AAP6JE57_9GAMM|nr:RNase adapter RapZ [Gammaproteobacteria bacterium AB-CW1]